MTPPALPYTGPRPKVALYATCMVDTLYPRVGMAAVDLLESRGVEVIFPERQTCCARVEGKAELPACCRYTTSRWCPWASSTEPLRPGSPHFGERTASMTCCVPDLESH